MGSASSPAMELSIVLSLCCESDLVLLALMSSCRHGEQCANTKHGIHIDHRGRLYENVAQDLDGLLDVGAVGVLLGCLLLQFLHIRHNALSISQCA